MKHLIDFSTELCGLRMKNPLIIGSSDVGRGISGFRKAAESGVGGIVMKSITDVVALQDPSISKFLCLNSEHKPWQLGDEAAAFYSRGGAMLTESEWAASVDEQVRLAHENDVLLIGSICASNIENGKSMARSMEDRGIKLIELNLGNPFYGASKTPMGAKIAQSEDLLAEVITAIRGAVAVPIMAKLSPQVGDIVQTVRVCADAGLSAVTLSHRFQGLLIDLDSQTPLSTSPFGYGGSWMLPIVLAFVAKVSKAVPIPICGSGGVVRWSDAIQLMMAGASAVQLTTAIYVHGTGIIGPMLEKMGEYCEAKSVRLADLVGSALNKTGYYDKMGPEDVVIMADDTACRRCTEKPCFGACYFDAVQLENGSVRISSDCTACGLCMQVCPYPGTLALGKK
jgi:dihydroorotate dehydrogenase/NAD-dependent dihydropyrimidine dehydrogenase PreA subunit